MGLGPGRTNVGQPPPFSAACGVRPAWVSCAPRRVFLGRISAAWRSGSEGRHAAHPRLLQRQFTGISRGSGQDTGRIAAVSGPEFARLASSGGDRHRTYLVDSWGLPALCQAPGIAAAPARSPFRCRYPGPSAASDAAIRACSWEPMPLFQPLRAEPCR